MFPVLSIHEKSVVVVARDQISCDIGGEAAILSLNDGVYYGLDLVGARVWSLVQEPQTFGALRDTLIKEYNVEADNLETDLRELLEELAQHGLIEVTT
ncbi:MAG: PqqD family protein [Pyrinomonadaceae bacterium]